jgi:hypothetical protein
MHEKRRRLRIWHARILAFSLLVLAELLIGVNFSSRGRLPFNFKNGFLPILVALPFFEVVWHFRILKKLAPEIPERDADTIAYLQAILMIMVYVSIVFILIILLGRN